jgi:chromosome condensin MukBEF ATPase and DNA-binding subunit MukB
MEQMASEMQIRVMTKAEIERKLYLLRDDEDLQHYQMHQTKMAIKMYETMLHKMNSLEDE